MPLRAPSPLRSVAAGIGSALRPRRPGALALGAVLCGFGIAAAGITLVRAADDAGILTFLRSESLRRAADYVRLPSQAPVRTTSEAREPVRADERTRRPVPYRNRVQVVAAGSRVPVTQTMCVRTCDGYTFPVGTLHGLQHLPAHATACQASCPGAETRLYTLAPGQSREQPGEARSVADGTTYRGLRTAFLFRKERVPSCSCTGADNIVSRLPLLLDPTLRAGDVVVAPDSTARIYAGNGRIPHAPRAFTDYRRSPAITVAGRADVDGKLGTSQREATARAYERSLRTRQAELRGGPLREVAPPAGSRAGVRVFTVRADAGVVDQSGARVILVR